MKIPSRADYDAINKTIMDVLQDFSDRLFIASNRILQRVS